jgi:AcrR family transcriptional regulator
MKQEQILTCAKDLFFKYGLRNVTMDDISRKLGMSKKTLYVLFKNKKEIVNAITEDFLKKYEADYEILIQNSENAIQELFLLMSNLKNVFEKIDFRLIQDMQRYFPEAWAMFEQHTKDFMYVKIRDNLIRGIKEELYRSDLKVEIIASLRLEEVQWSLTKEILFEDKFMIIEIHNEILIHYLYGITSSNGLKKINKYISNEI